DYVATSGTLTLNPGETSKPINVAVNGDNKLEDDETFFVNLSSPSNATVARGQGQGTITNDDLTPARVFVSTAGNDLNDCSNVNTPCRTFTGAINQVSSGGEVIVLRTGSYGGFSINKAIKINAPTGAVAFAATGV